MSSRLNLSGVGAVCAAVLCLAAFVFDAPPGAYHTVVGSGAEYESGACTDGFLCGAAYGGTFSIDASDKSGAHGSMRLNEVNIALTCVTIMHAKSGHTVYASGTGTDGKSYFATVSVPIAADSFIIGNHPGSRLCGVRGTGRRRGTGRSRSSRTHSRTAEIELLAVDALHLAAG